MNNAIEQYLKKNGFGTFCPKAVLFDMDGVLYDSMPTHAIAWQRSMKMFGIHMTEADAYATEGMRGIDTIRMLVKKQKGIDITEEEAQKMYDEKTHQFGLLPKTKIMPGLLDLMQEINDMGIKIGVVTGSGQRPLIKRLLDDFGQYLTPDHITTAYDVKRGKPYPDPYLMGLKKEGNLEPWEGLVVENAPMGVKAGVSARIFTIAVNSGPLPDSALAEQGANIIFQKMTDLRDAWPTLFQSHGKL